MKESFFEQDQSELTKAKISFYQSYIEGYLVKLLMGFGKCFIADLFCGFGRSGEDKGSPLILVDKIKYILTIPYLSSSQIIILFNDKDPYAIKNLKEEIEKADDDDHIKISIENKKFSNILPNILDELKNEVIPKFFFLDPFKYSDVKLKQLGDIMSLKNSEVLLFLPVFHSYRFASDLNLKKDHKTRIFVEEFTAKEVFDYTNIEDFMESMKEKIKKSLCLDFVRPILLDGGSNKNALFLLTKHEKGMLLMNNLCIKKSKGGSGIKVGENYENTDLLIGKNEILKITPRFKKFKNNLIEQLKKNKQMTTTEIKKFTIMEEFRPQDAAVILKELKKGGKINYVGRFYMAEKPNGETVFEYIEYK